jgi:hypothetical protein
VVQELSGADVIQPIDRTRVSSQTALIRSRTVAVGLCDHHAVRVFVYLPYQLSNGRTNPYETWYVHHGT